MPEWFWPDDDAALVPSDDRGLAYAQGVFETLRVGPGGCVLLEAHCERLLAGCRALGIPFGPDDLMRWREQAQEHGLLQKSVPAVLKVTVTAGSGGRGYRPPGRIEPRVITTVSELPEKPREGVRVRGCRQPLSADCPARGCKTLARLEQVLASAELEAGEFEGLMTFNGEPGWIEGTRFCLFSLAGRTLVTPPREKLAVTGTLRDWLVSNAERLGLDLEMRTLTPADIEAHGLLLGNSVMGLVPVSDFEGGRVPVDEGARQLVERLDRELGFG
ncbi:MAG: aminotransferase class IV [Pseudomonadota bacterium]